MLEVDADGSAERRLEVLQLGDASVALRHVASLHPLEPLVVGLFPVRVEVLRRRVVELQFEQRLFRDTGIGRIAP